MVSRRSVAIFAPALKEVATAINTCASGRADVSQSKIISARTQGPSWVIFGFWPILPVFVHQPNPNPPKEIPVRTFNNLALFGISDYAI
jgi:hypothetical protein